MKDERKISEPQRLGEKSEACLNDIGIYTHYDLASIGAIRAYLMLLEESTTKPSLNFLYAMQGAIEDKHWREIVRHDRERLLMELEDIKEMVNKAE